MHSQLAAQFLPAFLRIAAVHQGERVVCLAANQDELVRELVEHLGSEAEILATEGPETLSEHYWDVAVCHLGLADLADVPSTLEMLHRALRPVGRTVISAWAAPERVRWISLLLDSLRQIESGSVRLPMFAYGESGRLSRTLAEAGFEDVTPARVQEEAIFTDFDAYWRALQAEFADTARILARLDETRVAAVRADLERRTRPYRRRDGTLGLPMEALIVAAVK